MADAIRLLLAPFLWRCGSGLRRIFLYSLSNLGGQQDGTPTSRNAPKSKFRLLYTKKLELT